LNLKAVYVHVHVLVDVGVDGFSEFNFKPTPLEGPIIIKPPALPVRQQKFDYFGSVLYVPLP
jgi:hypothetical protein